MVVPMGVPYRRRAAAYPGRMSATFAGRLHVIVGPMFAGKTEELLRRVGRARLAGLDVEVVSHAIDTRGDHAQLLTHTGRSEPARMMSEAAELLDLAAAEGDLPDIIAIDEAQFFGSDLTGVVEELLAAGVQVEVAGLCVTYDGDRSEEHTSELQSRGHLVCRLLLEKKKTD